MVATLKQVASFTGVSIKTVSNVVNGRFTQVSPETRERVLQALVELNYQPNVAARHLRNVRLGVLALSTPDIANPYFTELAKEIITVAAGEQYTVLIDHTGGKREEELLVVKGLRPQLIDGVILNPIMLQLEDIPVPQTTTPIVLLGERLFGAPYDHVVIDNVAAARVATTHLLQLRRQRIAAIGISEEPKESIETMPNLRLRGYKEALLAAGRSLNSELMLPVSNNSFVRTDGIQAMQRLLALESPPDAVFCFNDLVALGAMKAIRDAGYRIPEDIAVVGFDNIEEGYMSGFPPLTTIAPDKAEIARNAVSLLIQRIQGTRTGAAEQIQPSFRLIERASTIGDR